MSQHPSARTVPKEYLIPFILTTCCFALWGFANDITNPLVKVFKEVFLISNQQSSLVQFAFYGGYATMAIPAALFIRRFSYKASIMLGFGLYAAGAFLTIPAATNASFNIFLLGFYVITFGLAFLETSCNPYILLMGPPETATQRLNLAQAFNPIGSLTGMTVASMVIAPQLQTGEFRQKLSDHSAEATQFLPMDTFPDGLPNFKEQFGTLDPAVTSGLETMRTRAPQVFDAMQQHDLGVVRNPYVAIGCVVLVFLILFAIVKMPSFKKEGGDASIGSIFKNLMKKPHYYEAVIAQAFYVGAQITCWTFIIHYGMEQVGLSLGQAQNWNIAAMGIFLASRFICTFLLRFISPGKLLGILAVAAIGFTLGAILIQGRTGLASLVAISGCMSLMFPTIYGIALKGLSDEEAKLGSAGLIIAIVGGAVLPLLQGKLIDDIGVRNSFWLPLVCFIVIAIFGFRSMARDRQITHRPHSDFV